MNKDNASLIDLETARALMARGRSVVPTETDGENHPKVKFAMARRAREQNKMHYSPVARRGCLPKANC